MRLDGGVTPSGTNDADYYLPRFFKSEYPDLVQYLDSYFDSLYKSSLTPEQIEVLLEDESWWDGRDLEYPSEAIRMLEKVKALDSYRKKNFGVYERVMNVLDGKILSRSVSELLSLDSFTLQTSDDYGLSSKDEDNTPLYQWLMEKNLIEIANAPSEDIRVDLVNLIKVARHLFKIRGTTECARIFLSAMYGGEVHVELPRLKIATLDDNFTLDEGIKLRDDFEYDEFTYIVNLVDSDYFKIGPKYFELYKRVFHASGFRCLFRVYTKEEWLLVSGEYLNQPEMIRVWEQFFNNEFASIMRGI